MKRIIVTILIVCVFSNLSLVDFNVQNVYGSTKGKSSVVKKKYIKVKIVSVTKKQLTLKITNKGDEYFHYYGGFTLKKRKKNKWKIVPFKEGVMFAKTRTVWGNSSNTVKFKWKKYFGTKLPKGKYKIKHVKVKKFTIN